MAVYTHLTHYDQFFYYYDHDCGIFFRSIPVDGFIPKNTVLQFHG